MLEWNLGQWYFVVQCDLCDSEIAFLEDPSQGRIPFDPPGSDLYFTLVCPYCGGECTYNVWQTTSVKAGL
jgi:hypothetical protein